MGMLFHVLAVKYPSAKTKATAANIKLTLKEYFNLDMAAIAANVASIAIGLLIVGEAINYKPQIANFIITLSAFYGFTGSSILIALFGQVNKRINNIVDEKTNKADGTSANVTDINNQK